MAKAGKIDPWNIDIVDVTDKYLAHMVQMKSQNLRVTGRTFLFAAVLLKLKSNVLEGIDIMQFEPEEPNIEYDDDGFIVDYGEEDLIRQLEFYEKLEQKQSLKSAHERAKRRVQSYSRLTPDDIVNLAHEEYIESCVLTLKENLGQIFEKNEKIELNELTLLGMDKISAYIALLFLTAESDYELQQDEFYSDLYVVKGEEKQEQLETSE